MMDFGARTDTGRVRKNNEDSYGAAPELDLFVLSDGMGGLESGEVASRLAVETILAHCREAEANPSLALIGEAVEGVSLTSERLASAIRLANHTIHHAIEENAAKRGMGATVVAVRFTDERMSIAHVGDSRAYRLRGENFEPLTQDHSFVAEQVRGGSLTQEQARESRLRSVLTRALGIDPEVQVDVNEELVTEDDTILLCSDGLTRELSDAQIAAVLAETEECQEAAGRLVDLANQAGGGDNTTAIVLRPSCRTVGAFARIGGLGRLFKRH
jgi:serine/threonine protein phosphatase PrpC